MMKFSKRLWLLVSVAILFSSCTSQKEISYLQGIPNSYEQIINESYEIKIQPNDLISIMVNSRDSELAQMFNLPVVSYQTDTKITGQNRVLGYLVTNEGTIDFPQLGVLHIAGMTRVELTEYIKNELISKGFITDPVVTVQFQNFQVSVLGEVNSPGTFEVSSDRITIFDALSRAGDMTIYGLRDRVKVIREKDGKRTITVVDLRGDKVLHSPFYYLQQNDVVYVEPNEAKAGQSKINQNRTIATYASIVSIILSALSLAL